MLKTYSELSRLKTFKERFEYLKLNGSVGKETFGYDRWLNQQFYRWPEWKKVRREVIVRDQGCDLGCSDREIHGELVFVHHMNPISMKDILDRSQFLLNPEYLITVSDSTHNAIHYGDESLLMLSEPIVRAPNDTCPWR